MYLYEVRPIRGKPIKINERGDVSRKNRRFAQFMMSLCVREARRAIEARIVYFSCLKITIHSCFDKSVKTKELRQD